MDIKDSQGNTLYRDKKGFTHSSPWERNDANERIEQERLRIAEIDAARAKIRKENAVRKYGNLGRHIVILGCTLLIPGLLAVLFLFNSDWNKNVSFHNNVALVAFPLCLVGYYITHIGVTRAERWKDLDAAYLAFLAKVRSVIYTIVAICFCSIVILSIVYNKFLSH